MCLRRLNPITDIFYSASPTHPHIYKFTHSWIPILEEMARWACQRMLVEPDTQYSTSYPKIFFQVKRRRNCTKAMIESTNSWRLTESQPELQSKNWFTGNIFCSCLLTSKTRNLLIVVSNDIPYTNIFYLLFFSNT